MASSRVLAPVMGIQICCQAGSKESVAVHASPTLDHKLALFHKDTGFIFRIKLAEK